MNKGLNSTRKRVVSLNLEKYRQLINACIYLSTRKRQLNMLATDNHLFVDRE